MFPWCPLSFFYLSFLHFWITQLKKKISRITKRQSLVTSSTSNFIEKLRAGRGISIMVSFHLFLLFSKKFQEIVLALSISVLWRSNALLRGKQKLKTIIVILTLSGEREKSVEAQRPRLHHLSLGYSFTSIKGKWFAKYSNCLPTSKQFSTWLLCT